jgi:outer membrane phospholipase A
LFALAFTLALAAGPARADTLLQAPQHPVAPGEDLALVLLVTNGTSAPQASTPPAVLPLVVRYGQSAVSAVFRPEPHAVFTAVIPPGGFRRTLYRAVLPREATGLVVLDASGSGAGRVAIEVVTPPPGVPASNALVSATSSNEPPPAPPQALGPQEFGFSPHEPIYFCVGGNGGANARFQLSFKFRPVGPSDDRIAGYHTWEDLYFAYTQTSLWDLHSVSKPFTDSSYRPSLFFYRYDLEREFAGAQLGLASGFEHESNGRDGANSRSINILFVRPTLRWGPAEGWQVQFSPKLYAYLEKSENSDIARFRGYGDYALTLMHPRSWKLTATTRLGTSGKGSLLIDASFPFSRINDHFPLGWVHGYLSFQYFNGWGESLLHYNQRAETQFRVGFMPIR